jgi:tape measure domain-containing protein
MATQKEILQLLIEVGGERDVAGLADALDALKGSSEAGAAAAAEFVGELDRLARAKSAASNLGTLKAQLAELEPALDQASRTALALKLEMGSVEKPTREMERAFGSARAEVARLEEQQRTLTLELRRSEGALAKAGVDTARLSTETDRLGRELSQTAQEVRKQAAASAAAANSQQKHTAAAERGVGIFQRLGAAIVAFIAAIGIREILRAGAALLGLGEAADKTERQFARLYGGADSGRVALGDLRKLADDLGQNFETLRGQAAKLKTFGLEPLDGTLRSLVDQNTAAGGSNEDLEGKILAVGQAWAKQKLQGEEALQLMERGIPVWELLAKATGKNVPELQKLSEAGKLGRNEIRLLLQEIGKANAGAAAEAVQGLTARFEQLRNKLREIGEDFAREGNTQALADSLGRVRQELQELADSPEFEQVKRALSGVFQESLAAAEGFLKSEELRVAAADLAKSLNGIRDAMALLNAEIPLANQSLLQMLGDLNRAASLPLNLLAQLTTDLRQRLVPGLGEGKKAADALADGLEAVKREAEGMNPVLAAFSAMWEGAKRAAGDSAPLIQAAMKAIGVDAQNSGIKVTEAGKVIIEHLNFLATQAAVTSQEFRAAFVKSIDSAQTVTEVQKMEAALKRAFEVGKIGAGEYAILAARAAEKQIEIKKTADELAGGLGGLGDAAEKEAQRTIAAMEATRSSLAGTASIVSRQLAEAIHTGTDPAKVERLTAKLAETEAQIRATTASIAEMREGLASTGAQSEAALGQVSEAASAAGEGLEQAGDSTEGLGAKIGGVLGQLVAMFQKFSAISGGAAEFFKDAYNSSVRLSHSLGDVAEAIARAERATDAAIAAQKAAATGMQGLFDAVTQSGQEAALAFRLLSQTGEDGLRGMAEQARQGKSQLDLLNQADLDVLAQSAERAAQKLAEIKAQAKAATDELAAMNRQLLDEADRAAGNQAAVLEREHQDRLRKIEELSRQAGEQGRLVADETRRRAEASYQAELARIQAEAKARIDAERETANARVDAAKRTREALQDVGGPSTRAGGAGALEVILKVRNEQTTGSPLARLTEEDLDRLVAMLLGRIALFKGVS